MIPVRDVRGMRAAVRSASSTRRGSTSTTSACGTRPSTTCSSRSPGTRPRRTNPIRGRDDEARAEGEEERMTTVDDAARRSPDSPIRRAGRLWLLRDSWTEATRHLKALPRNPELLVFAALQPIMFVVLFVYVFGGSINVPGLLELQAVRDPRDLRPDRAVRLDLHRSRHRRGPAARASSTGCARCRCTRRRCCSGAR